MSLSMQNMDSWKRFNEASLSDKKELYRSLNMQNIENADYNF